MNNAAKTAIDLDALEREWYEGFGPGFGDRLHAVTAELRASRKVVEAVGKVAWNERDGKCWCPSSPELNPMGFEHSTGCLAVRQALAEVAHNRE